MYWREKELCAEKKFEFCKLYLDFSILYICGYLIAPAMFKFIPPIGSFYNNFPYSRTFVTGGIVLGSFLLFKVFTKSQCE